VVIGERAKIEEPLMVFKFFIYIQIVFKLNKTAVLQGNKQKMPEICEDTVGIRPMGFPCFLFANPEGTASIRSLLLSEHFPKCLCYSVNIAEKVCSPLWAFPKESLIPFRFCLNGLPEPLGLFPKMSWNRFGYFLYIFLEEACFCLLRLKIRDTTEKFKHHQRFYSQLRSIPPYHLWPNSIL
jgi:hypothetical protein